jgi:2,6-dihydroxypyridine 3-monooxygenase
MIRPMAGRHRRERRAAVVGGSFGGLTAALLLRDAGWDVDVFERSAAVLEGRGGGIVLHPATIRYPVERGGATTAELGVPVAWLRYLDGAGGVAYQGRCSYRFTSYDVLYRRLLECFGRGRYHLDEECVGLRDAGAALVELASGRTAEAELVVFADGINSLGRRLLAPAAEPQYAGYVAWRGTVEEARVEPSAPKVLEDAITYHVLADGHFITYPIPGALRNWLWYRNAPPGPELERLLTGGDGTRFTTSVPRGLVAPERVRELVLSAEACLPPPLAGVVCETPGPFVQVIFDLAVERTTSGRACLIGDAAFTARPHVAVGTAKAAEDAWTLAAALGGVRSCEVAEALAAWSPGQIALGSAAVARSREAGTRLQDGTWRVGEPLPYGLYRIGDSALPDD